MLVECFVPIADTETVNYTGRNEIRTKCMPGIKVLSITDMVDDHGV